MPFFKTNKNILETPWEDELSESKYYNSNNLILPPGGPDDPHAKWDYKRMMKIEDVDIWEQIYYASGNIGLYAAWLPYVEFYMITLPAPNIPYSPKTMLIETYYGQGAQDEVYNRCLEIGIPMWVSKKWVDNEDMWLFTPNYDKKNILV